MSRVSLDGLRIERGHLLELSEAAKRVAAAASDLSKGSLARQRPVISNPEPERILLSGGNGGTRFEAEIRLASDRVTIDVSGALELSFIELTVAGGSTGVRNRVRAEIERVLEDRLGGADRPDED